MIYGSITNCTVVGHGVRSEWECRLGYQIISEDTATNTREIKLQLEARTIHSKYTAVGNQLTPTIDGVPLNPIGMNFSASNVNVWQVLGTRTITITGAFNGIKTGSFTTNLTGDWGLKSGSASVTINLANLHTPPVVTKVTMQEKNSLVNSYTGIVQFLSSKTITFTTTTYDNATISSYQVYHNGVLIGSSTANGMTIDFDKVGTLITFPMNNKTYCTLRFVVIDSYGTSGYLESQYEVIPYVKPNLVQTSSSVKRNGQLSGKVKLNLVGSFYNQKVNNVANTIKLEFTYYKKGETEPTTYYTIPFTLNGNSLNISNWSVAINNQEITDIDKNYAYNFKIRATDHFNKQSEITLLCPVGEYVWAEFKDRVDFKDITIKNQNPFVYSTKETRIGSLEDGTAVYRKMYFGTIANTDKEIIESNIINKDIFNYNDGAVHNQSGTQLGLGYNREGYGSQLYLYNNELTLAHTSDIVGKYRIILDYAKTRGYLVKGNSYQETTIGKNLFNMLTISSNTFLKSVDENRLVLEAVNSSGAQYLSNYIRDVDSTKSFTFSFKSKKTKVGLTGDPLIRIIIYGSNDNSTYTLLHSLAKSTPEENVEYSFFKTVTGYSYYRFFIYNNGSNNVTIGESTEYWDIQFEEGTTVTNWEKFTYGASPNPQYPQEIEVVDNVKIKVGNKETTIDLKGNCVSKLGDIQDYLLIHKNKYWLVKNVGKVVLNGSESWYAQDRELTNTWRYYTSNILPNSVPNISLSNRFKNANVNVINSNDEEALCRINEKQIAIRLNKSRATTLANFKTWLSNNNVTVYYLLAQPQVIELGELPEEVEVSDDVQLISNLDTTIEITDNFDFDTYKTY